MKEARLLPKSVYKFCVLMQWQTTFYFCVEQQTGSKQGKGYAKAVCCHPAYFTYMQRSLSEMPDCMKHKLESKLLGEISITSDMEMTPPLRQKAKKN